MGVFCPFCGHSAEPDWKYCRSCGRGQPRQGKPTEDSDATALGVRINTTGGAATKAPDAAATARNEPDKSGVVAPATQQRNRFAAGQEPAQLTPAVSPLNVFRNVLLDRAVVSTKIGAVAWILVIIPIWATTWEGMGEPHTDDNYPVVFVTLTACVLWFLLAISLDNGSRLAYRIARLSLLLLIVDLVVLVLGFLGATAGRLMDIPSVAIFSSDLFLTGISVLVLLVQTGGWLVALSFLIFLSRGSVAAFFGCVCPQCRGARWIKRAAVEPVTYRCTRCSALWVIRPYHLDKEERAAPHQLPPDSPGQQTPRQSPTQADEWLCRCGHINPKEIDRCEECRRAPNAII